MPGAVIKKGQAKNDCEKVHSIEYKDQRVIISAKGCTSTFDDIDSGEDLTGKNGFGSSFGHRVFLSSDAMKKQIRNNLETYLELVGGTRKVKEYLNWVNFEKSKAKDTDANKGYNRSSMNKRNIIPIKMLNSS